MQRGCWDCIGYLLGRVLTGQRGWVERLELICSGSRSELVMNHGRDEDRLHLEVARRRFG